MNTYTITSSSVLWECGKVGDFSIFPQNIEKKNLLNCIQKCSHKIFGFCLINKKLDKMRSGFPHGSAGESYENTRLVAIPSK